MKFVIMVNEGPYQHQASDSAYQFTRAALEKKHQVVRVFFYHDGVNNGNRLTIPPQDEHKTVERWVQLARQYDLDLVVCVAAAQRRGIMDSRESSRHDLDAENISSGFRIAGLGQLVESIGEADRFLTFGD